MIKNALLAIVIATAATGCATAKPDNLTVRARALKPDCERRNQHGLSCLACAVYFESRGEPDRGQQMVAHVVLNRAKNKRFPNDICRVVWQKGQFHWTQDRHSNRPRDPKSWARAVRNAEMATAENNAAPNFLFFRRAKSGGVKIGHHVFR